MFLGEVSAVPVTDILTLDVLERAGNRIKNILTHWHRIFPSARFTVQPVIAHDPMLVPPIGSPYNDFVLTGYVWTKDKDGDRRTWRIEADVFEIPPDFFRLYKHDANGPNRDGYTHIEEAGRQARRGDANIIGWGSWVRDKWMPEGTDYAAWKGLTGYFEMPLTVRWCWEQGFLNSNLRTLNCNGFEMFVNEGFGVIEVLLMRPGDLERPIVLLRSSKGNVVRDIHHARDLIEERIADQLGLLEPEDPDDPIGFWRDWPR